MEGFCVKGLTKYYHGDIMWKDKAGHFTSKENNGKECTHNKGKTEYRQNTRYEEIVNDKVFPETAYGFANKERKYTKDHIAHAKEMGFKNQDDYEKEACRFFNSNEGELYYSERRDRFYRYDEKKERYVVSSYGVIHTFMNVTKKKFLKIEAEDKLVWIK